MTMSQLFSSVTAGGITAQAYLLCAAVSLLLGALIAFTYTRRTRYTQSFVLTLILLPLTVQTVIMLVNGNVGTGVAVAGAFSLVRFRVGLDRSGEKELHITIPETLDYTEIFDDVFARYTAHTELVEVKTASLGSLYKLHYHIRLKKDAEEKAFLDALRCRNGNLEVRCGRLQPTPEQL